MKTPLRISLALSALLLLPVSGAIAQDANPAPVQQVKYSTEQLDNLVASIALYPDAILAQVLIAATFPDQIDLAVKYVRAHGTNGIDDQAWDVSVKSVAHYAPVLNMMAERPDWTAALGQAYAVQSSDVMESVQHLRQMASAQGNLVSTPEQKVVTDRDNIRIEPAQPQVIYVPVYDPAVIYYEPVFAYGRGYRGYWTFGMGYPVGSWLMYDFDWYGRSMYYDDWSFGYGWRSYARPFISVNFFYLQPRYRNVFYNRAVVYHNVNYQNFDRFNTVHRGTNWNDHRGDNRGYADRSRNDNRGPGNVNGRSDGRTQAPPSHNDSRAQFPTNVQRPGTTRNTYAPPAPVVRQPNRTADPRRGGPGQFELPQRSQEPVGRPAQPRESKPSDARSQSRPSAPPQGRSAPPPSRSSSPPPKSSGSSGGGKGSSSSSSRGSSNHKG